MALIPEAMTWFPAKATNDSVKGNPGPSADAVVRRVYAEMRALSCYSQKHLATKHQGNEHQDVLEHSLFPGGRGNSNCVGTQEGQMQLGKRGYNFASPFLLPTSQKKIPKTQENSRRTFPPMQMLNHFTKVVPFILYLVPGTLQSRQ